MLKRSCTCERPPRTPHTSAEREPALHRRVWGHAERATYPLSSECGTYKTVRARFWLWLSCKSHLNVLSCCLLARKRVGPIGCEAQDALSECNTRPGRETPQPRTLHRHPLHPEPQMLRPQTATALLAGALWRVGVRPLATRPLMILRVDASVSSHSGDAYLGLVPRVHHTPHAKRPTRNAQTPTPKPCTRNLNSSSLPQGCNRPASPHTY